MGTGTGTGMGMGMGMGAGAGADADAGTGTGSGFEAGGDHGTPPVAAGVVGERLVERLKLVDPTQSIDLTVVADPKVAAAEVEAFFQRPGWSWRIRAPRVYEVTLPSQNALRDLLVAAGSRLRRVETAGRVSGEPVVASDDRVELAISFQRTGSQKAGRRSGLERLGLTILAEEPDLVVAAGRGDAVAELVLAPLVGPVHVQSVDPSS